MRQPRARVAVSELRAAANRLAVCISTAQEELSRLQRLIRMSAVEPRPEPTFAVAERPWSWK